MRLPLPVSLFGYAGLIPFLLGPAWLGFSPATVPDWLDAVWLSYCALIAAFMAGTLWGFALPACEGAAGLAGLLIAMALMLLAWFSTALPFRPALAVLATYRQDRWVMSSLAVAAIGSMFSMANSGGPGQQATAKAVPLLLAVFRPP